MDVCFVLLPKHAEPNNDSPLNTQAAALWANQEGTRSGSDYFV
jgi:ubiquitin-protein ligase